MKLVSNGFRYRVIEEKNTLYYSENSHPLAKRVTLKKYSNIINDILVKGELELPQNKKYFYYTFTPFENLDKQVKVDLTPNKTIQREFVKWKLYEKLKEHYIIDFMGYGRDLALYCENPNSKWSGWNSYTVYNLKIRNWEIHLSIGSRNTLISQQPVEDSEFNGIPIYKVLAKGHIVHVNNIPSGRYPCIASHEVRIQENLIQGPVWPNYSNYYKEIKGVYEKLVSFKYNGIQLMKDGFTKLEKGKNIFPIAHNFNVMEFKNGSTNVNASNGMRYAGPYKQPEVDLSNLEFVFIYSNSNQAKELYYSFQNGKTSYYPGLERYVSIPFRKPEDDTPLKYDRKSFAYLPEKLDQHLENLKKNNPDRLYFAIILLPYSKNNQDIDDEDDEYFDLKRVLLKHEVPSQFIKESAIGTTNFVYWLPNISIAIHAKLGGIPWKLNRDDEKELIIGFGDATESDEKFIGSTVYFDNTGRLKTSEYFRENNIKAFKSSIKNAIINFIEENSIKPERLIIHYFKLPGAREKELVKDALQDLNLQIPYVIVSINETKAKDYIAFDESYGYGMPMSGTSWRISGSEHVLFNNTRYEEKPRSGRPFKQVYPIKLKIWFSDNHQRTNDNIKKIIGQVFEFSRMYWKSIHQQSKPVTAKYSEIIAKFGSQFDDEIPQNALTKKTPWFI